MQGIIVLAVLPAFFVNTEPANKTSQNSVETDRYTLIEQSDNLQYASGMCSKEMCLPLDSGNRTLIKWSTIGHNEV